MKEIHDNEYIADHISVNSQLVAETFKDWSLVLCDGVCIKGKF